MFDLVRMPGRLRTASRPENTRLRTGQNLTGGGWVVCRYVDEGNWSGHKEN